MKRRTEHLVEKRDGRREFLRATKLARSVHLALYEIGVDEDWRALDLASVVLEGLRQKRAVAGSKIAASHAAGFAMPVPAVGSLVLTTAEIADAVQHLLVVTGQPTAAVAYGAVQAERARRRNLLGDRLIAASAPALPKSPAASASAYADTGSYSAAEIGKAAPRKTNKVAGSKPQTNSTNRFGGVWPGEG